MLLSLSVSMSQSAPHRQLAFYEVIPVDGKADVSGRLPEAVWEKIPRSDISYMYWKAEPVPGVLKSSFQMAYDKEGVYLRVTNYEDQMDKLRATISKRGNPNLWTDDCVEIYFDPSATGVGFMVFTINSLGAQNDRKQLDAAVSLPEWRGDNWQAWGSKKDNAWVVEAFFPFLDLGSKVIPGTIWMFNLVRYAYTTGKFQGTTWSPGGNYNRPGDFGYLYFGDGKAASTERVAEILKSKVTIPWIASVGGKILRYNGSDKVKVLSAEDVRRNLMEEAESAIKKLVPFQRDNPELVGIIEQLRARLKNVSFQNVDEALHGVRTVGEIVGPAQDLYWSKMIQALINETSEKQNAH